MLWFKRKKDEAEPRKPEVSDIEPAVDVDAACVDNAALTEAAESEAAVDMSDNDPRVPEITEPAPTPNNVTAEIAHQTDIHEAAVDAAEGQSAPPEAQVHDTSGMTLDTKPVEPQTYPDKLTNAAESETVTNALDDDPEARAVAAGVSPATITPPQETATATTGNLNQAAGREAAVDMATAQPAFASGPPKKEGYLARLKAKLVKTRNSLTGGVDGLFVKHSTIDDDLLEELEELLITADLGVDTAMDIVQAVAVKKNSDADQVKAVLKQEILKRLQYQPPKPQTSAKPEVIMVVGVNGVGKTTTIGKLASKWANDGLEVMIGAGDTFRAAAVEQLEVWANRSGASIIKHKPETDPAAVAYDSVEAGLARKMDKVIIDTAGRLHTNSNLMEELKKIKRSIAKKMPDAPHEVWLVLDATTGQNALSQAKLFDAALDLTGLVLTKLDGTAKGGIVVAIASELKIPIKYIGIGEKVEDLQEFDPVQFVDALF